MPSSSLVRVPFMYSLAPCRSDPQTINQGESNISDDSQQPQQQSKRLSKSIEKKLNRRIESFLDKESIRLFHLFLYWIFDSLLHFMISNCFYVTETEGKGNELFYFQKKIWFEIVKDNLQQFEHHFAPVSVSSLCYPSNIRLSASMSVQ
jgi:hypothetical protein